jgi:hypothetical protein
MFTYRFLILAIGAVTMSAASPPYPGTILYGAAYYEEYSPCDRLDADVRLLAY